MPVGLLIWLVWQLIAVPLPDVNHVRALMIFAAAIGLYCGAFIGGWKRSGARVLRLLLAPAVWAAPPNVIVLIRTARGYGELSTHDNSVLKTPHLDRLPAESVRLSDFHLA
jgi:hypothetical protein